MIPGFLRRFYNDCWRKLHGWNVITDRDGVKWWVRR